VDETGELRHDTEPFLRWYESKEFPPSEEEKERERAEDNVEDDC
jgi:hypothetical protein